VKRRDHPPAGDPPVESSQACPVDDRELARFLKPQPPLVVPERSKPAFEPGYLAHTLLGNRVYKGIR